jgi:hypothetical protein
MFLSPKNKQVLSQIIVENNKIPQHLKNEFLVIKSMDEFNTRENMNKPISDLNKSFLLSYINQTKNNFENELKKHQTDFENTIILKKPQNIQFEEIKEEVLDETNMEKGLRQKMEERQKEMDVILSQQKPIEPIEPEPIKEVETKLMELQNNVVYENLKKKVSFQDEITDPPATDPKIEVIMLELAFIKQELTELKKMIAMLTTFIQSQ